MNRPLTIWRYTAADLWRMLLLTATVLVAVISFGLTIKFFAEGALGPLETLAFMVFASVPMLQYTLPFAAGFSATLAYHRLAHDNELTGAYAGGVSHRGLLLPAAATGLVLAGTLSLLSEQVIPRFLLAMEDMVSQSVGKVIVNSVQRGEPLEYGRYRVWADQIHRIRPEGGAQEEFRLLGVAVAEIGGDGRVGSIATARSARVALLPGRMDEGGPAAWGTARDDATMVWIRLQDAVQQRGDGYAQTGEISVVEMIPRLFDDNPKYLTWGELRKAARNPDMLNVVGVRRETLAMHLGERLLTSSMDRVLGSEGRVLLRDEDGRQWVVRASGIGWDPGVGAWRFSGAPVRVERIAAPGFPGVTLTAAEALMATSMGHDMGTRRLGCRLELTDVTVGPTGSPEARYSELTVPGLRMAEDRLPALLELSSAELLELVRPRVEGPHPDRFLLNPARELSRRIGRLEREILSKQHERMAMSVSCLVMVLIGAVMAMRLGGGSTRMAGAPLAVYLWSFFPALVTVLMISAGQQMTERLGAPGLAVLWGGAGALGLYTLGAYLLVRRH